MTKRTVLIIEDDAPIRMGIVDALEFAGFKVRQAPDGHKGMDMALGVDCDLILLDLMLPGPSGLEILRKVRDYRAALPVIILTARGGESDRVAGLRLGADDYIVKPFSIKELLARVEAVLRRSAERPQPVQTIDIPGGSVDLDKREVRFTDKTRTELSEREVELLRYLAANSGRAIAREELLARVWRIKPEGLQTRTIDMHVARLREKLRDDTEEPLLIRTIRGKGYTFVMRP